MKKSTAVQKRTRAVHRLLLPLLPAAAGLVLAACPGPLPLPPMPPPDPAGFVLPFPATDTLREPFTIRSRNGVLDVTLAAVMADTVISVGTSTVQGPLRLYQVFGIDGKPLLGSRPVFPGPTFRVRRGDRIRIKLLNQLPGSGDDRTHACMDYPAAKQQGSLPPVDTFPNCFHGPNSTNIHYHGFHVTPQSPGDNVLLQIAPDSSFQYAFQIPWNQSPGTHWYHPHKHGSVALQVTNGMSGAFIVEGGGLDYLADAFGMREHLVAVQQIRQNVNLVDSTGTQVTLVNGQVNPVIVMRPGEVQRWRIVNENVSRTATYKLFFQKTPGADEPALYDVARDGVQYAPANYDRTEDTALVVAPGSRLDVFVQAPQDTGFHLFQANVANQVARSRKTQGAVGAAPALLRVYVRPAAGEAYPDTLPAALPELPDFLANLDTITRAPAVRPVFSDTLPSTQKGATHASPTRFFLGSAKQPYMRFDTARVFVRMPLDSTQVWEVINRSATINHPFHIHINPFQVDSVVYGPKDPAAPLFEMLNAAAAGGNPIWLDVVPLPVRFAPDPKKPDSLVNGSVWIRQRYDRFQDCPDCGPPTGQFVMHCHILGHEERGMMQLLEIYDPGKKAEAGKEPAAGHSHSHH